MDEKETEYLEGLLEMEDLAEKKANIYARLLTDVNLAKKMEEFALRHTERKRELEVLLYGKAQTKKREESAQ